MRTHNKYKIPITKDFLQKIDRNSSPAHIGKLRNAVDFIAPEDTPVLAAANGIVTYVKDDSNTGWSRPILLGLYKFYCNYAFSWGIFKMYHLKIS